jgi:hypothetical protein
VRRAHWIGALAALVALGALGSLETPPPVQPTGAAWLWAPLLGLSAAGPVAALGGAAAALLFGGAAWVRRRRHRARWLEVERIERSLYSKRRWWRVRS